MLFLSCLVWSSLTGVFRCLHFFIEVLQLERFGMAGTLQDGVPTFDYGGGKRCLSVCLSVYFTGKNYIVFVDISGVEWSGR